MNRLFCCLCLVAFAATLGGGAGCSRQHYRMKADREVHSILRQNTNDPRWKVNNTNITPKTASRMFDPFCPDCEPMPVDDPAAHKKMHSVAGMKGSAHWYDSGQTASVDSPRWRQYLMVNDKGEVPLDKEQAVELSILHSPEYQAALENLYLSAMQVSQERFRYDVQFFGGDSLLWNRQNSGATLSNGVDASAKKLFATGGQWTVELANSVVWSLNGQNTWNTGISTSLTQPLLRGASRKVVLENLTQTERTFLAAVRQMVFYQQGHYTRIVTGSGRQGIPSGNSTTLIPTSPSGFYGLLVEQIKIQNQRQNILGLEGNLNRFTEMFEIGQTGKSQIMEMQQSLLTSQSGLLGRTNTYQGNVETYIRSLGLPPDLKVSISDPLLEQFQFSSPSLITLMEDVAELLAMLRKKDQPISEQFREEIKNVIQRTEGEIALLEQDLESLQKNIPERLAGLKNLEALLAERIRNGERIDKSVYDTEDFEDRIAKLRTEEVPQNLERLQAAFTLLNLIVETEEQTLRTMIQDRTFAPAALDALKSLNLNETAEADTDPGVLIRQKERNKPTEPPPPPLLQDVFSNEPPKLPLNEPIEEPNEARRIIAGLRQKEVYRDWILRVVPAFHNELMSLMLIQTRARLDAMTLVPVSITSEEAFHTASENRLDWMNQKSQLVDTWRQIDIRADALKGELNLKLDGEIATGRNSRGNVDNGSLQARLEWDTPLTRHTEMMNYRRSQVAYQNARRSYYMYVDGVQAELQNIVRNVQMRQVEFEIRRNAVLVGTTRVDVMQLQMEQPAKRGAPIDTNTSRDLISALDGLMSSQDNFLDTWVAYQTQRMLLDLSMGTMKLDARGHWIDPGAMGTVAATAPAPTPKMLPLPLLNVEPPQRNRRYVEE